MSICRVSCRSMPRAVRPRRAGRPRRRPTPHDRPPGVARSNTEHHIRSKGPKTLFRVLRPAAPRLEKEWAMPVNQGVRCQLEADVSLAVVCFGDELKTGARSTLEFLDAAVSLGFRSVELCDRSVRDPATVRQALRDRDLAMPSIALRNDFTGDRASVGDNVDHLISWLTIAASFGCRLARVWTGWRRVDATARRQIIGAFDEGVPHARQVGVALAVETHGGLSNDPAFLEDLCDRYPDGAFGVCLDFGNIPADGRRFAIRRLARLTNHVHVKSYQFDDR